VFVLPFILLLALPEIIQKRQCWLRLWMIACLVNGLYYPSCGAALLFAGLPFAFVQLYFWFKNGEAKTAVRSCSFWLWWGLCLLPVVLLLPMLCRMFLY